VGSAHTLPSGVRAERRHRAPIVGPFILIGLGVLFLGQNLGFWGSDVWLSIWRFWPLLLVAAGLEIIVGRSSWAGAIGLIVVVVLVGAVVTLTTDIAQLGRWTLDSDGDLVAAAGLQTTDRVSEKLGDASEATVEIHHGAGRLDVSALSFGSDELIQAEMAHDQKASIQRHIQRLGDSVQVRLDGQSRADHGVSIGNVHNDWAVQLSPKTSLALRVEAGASQINLDLRQLAVKRLDLQVGASAARITLPQSAERTEAYINAGAADVQVTVPEGVAARIHLRGLSSNKIDEGRFPRMGEYYQSPNYETAANRVTIEVEAGLSSLTIR